MIYTEKEDKEGQRSRASRGSLKPRHQFLPQQQTEGLHWGCSQESLLPHLPEL
jgi:hypothetical protein